MVWKMLRWLEQVHEQGWTCGSRDLCGRPSQKQAGGEPLDLLVVVGAVQVAGGGALLADGLREELLEEASHGHHAAGDSIVPSEELHGNRVSSFKGGSCNTDLG